MQAPLPMAWVKRWFLKSTWDNFSDLRASNELLALSPERQTHMLFLERFCPSRKTMYTRPYLDGWLVEQRCCSNPKCTSEAPGVKYRWPKDPKQLYAAYEKVALSDRALATSMGWTRDPNRSPFNVYSHETELMTEYIASRASTSPDVVEVTESSEKPPFSIRFRWAVNWFLTNVLKM